ncbi:hypothetical protein [Streptomyces sp. NPDC002769]|uniref:hypothetical protein n=1 Tax=Streptomyces sp. NPDC002769 TaxID=3154542 RepID=UPI003323D3EF
MIARHDSSPQQLVLAALLGAYWLDSPPQYHGRHTPRADGPQPASRTETTRPPRQERDGPPTGSPGR